MASPFQAGWLPGLLWAGTLGVAVTLVLLVLVCPLLVGRPNEDGPLRVLGLFAHDAAVRRTALASAIGLIVTASVFFRPVVRPPTARRRSERPSPPGVAGA